MKRILRIPMTLMLMWLAGYLMLVLAYCIPTGNMERHVQRSVSTFLKEGIYPWLTDMKDSQLDNYTDALMLLTASYPSDENAWKAAANVRRYHIEEQNPVETLLSIYGEGEEELEVVGYQRYWHGYLIFLKPLLLFFNYSQIRYLVMTGQLCLFSLLVASLAEQKRELVLPTAFLWLFLNPIATMCSLQFNSIVVVTFAVMILIVRLSNLWKDDMDKWGMLFLWVGGISSYMDMLTYPLVVLGASLILWSAFRERATSAYRNLLHVLKLSFLWAVGYGGMWGGKWILGSVITGKNIIRDAFEQALFRASPFLTAENHQRITYNTIIKKMLGYSWKYIMMSVIVAMVYFLIYRLLHIKKVKSISLLIYVFIGIYPFGWYLVLKNHSYIHAFFTYRELAITAYAIMVSIANRMNWQ